MEKTRRGIVTIDITGNDVGFQVIFESIQEEKDLEETKKQNISEPILEIIPVENNK